MVPVNKNEKNERTLNEIDIHFYQEELAKNYKNMQTPNSVNVNLPYTVYKGNDIECKYLLYSDVFRTPPNIYDGAFLRKPVKNLNCRRLAGF